MPSIVGTAIVIIVIVVICFFAIRHIIKRKKAGKGCCGCGCESCSGCH